MRTAWLVGAWFALHASAFSADAAPTSSPVTLGDLGRKMQDDIGDALTLLVEQKVADPGRVCIVGASYGGYAALAGATLTPELYKCVVSIAGVSDLDEMLKKERRNFGKDSAVYAYWVRQIGDPDRDADRIATISPVTHADRVKAPILLVHGDDDDIVPYERTRRPC